MGPRSTLPNGGIAGGESIARGESIAGGQSIAGETVLRIGYLAFHILLHGA